MELQLNDQVASVRAEQVMRCQCYHLNQSALAALIEARWCALLLLSAFLQPLAEYAALLDLQDLPHINAPLKIILDKHGVDFIYANCGQNAMQWRKQLVHEDDEHKVGACDGWCLYQCSYDAASMAASKVEHQCGRHAARQAEISWRTSAFNA